ncbi:nickase [Marinilactibacillus psychrotolerans]|uniref:MobQ family relaxase n=1 Tax=Marinilactibacillus psychrotolerans TaxID=191770 RepID=UPI001C7DADDC|nr:MobQ family relaxase [Marinilactibacillus psychrotolerans]GEQ33604.1 nickase [Marinilactibacillus psychrotolerans]
MAQYSFNCKIMSRAKGHSAIASASYRSGEKLYSERYGQYNFYAREVKPETFIMKPDHVPKWVLDREKLWNGVEEQEKHEKAQLARSFTIALPNEMTNEEQRDLIEEFAKKQLVDRGMVADIAIHRDDENNPHAHILTTVRPFDENGNWGDKTKKEYLLDEEGKKQKTKAGNIRSRKVDLTGWGNKEVFKEWREEWANIQNSHLEKNGYSDRVTDKSYAEQGVEKIPTIHEGYVAREMEKDGKISDRMEINRTIKKSNNKEETERKECVIEKVKDIIVPLNENDKKLILSLANELKMNNIDAYNLNEKRRLSSNWNRSLNIKNEGLINKNEFTQKITYKSIYDQTLNKFEEVYNDRNTAIIDKYYPAISEKNPSNYYKQILAEETIKKDRILNNKEVKDLLTEAKENELNYRLQRVYSKPYTENIKVFQKVFVKSRKAKEDFLSEHNLDIKDTEGINRLEPKEKELLKSLITKEEIAYDSIKISEKYFDETILSKYPTLKVEKLNIQEKESLSKVIDYYGDRLTDDKVISAGQQENIMKYNYYERKMATEYLYKLDNKFFTEDELISIENEPFKREILETVTDPAKREMFISELKESGELEKYQSIIEFEGEERGIGKNPLISLVSSGNLYNNLMQASEDNARRRSEKLNNNKPASVKKVNKTKKRNSPTIY